MNGVLITLNDTTKVEYILKCILIKTGKENLTALQRLCRSLYSRGLRRGSTAACVLGLRVRIPQGHGFLSLTSVVCCQVEISATGGSLVWRSPTECCESNGAWTRYLNNGET